MTTSLQILLGLVLCGAGLATVAGNPFSGCSAIFLGGVLILAGIDPLGHTDRFDGVFKSGGADER